MKSDRLLRNVVVFQQDGPPICVVPLWQFLDNTFQVDRVERKVLNIGHPNPRFNPTWTFSVGMVDIKSLGDAATYCK